MRYTSDLIKKILSSPEGQRILDQISPIYQNSYIGLWFLQIIGRQLDDLATWTGQFKAQTRPQTATWGLPFWEQSKNIPIDKALTTEQRREQLMARIMSRAPMPPSKLAAIATAAAGAPARIIERTAKNQFTVAFDSISASIRNVQLVQDSVARAKPAHLTFVIKYTSGTSDAFYHGGVVNLTKSFTIGQVN